MFARSCAYFFNVKLIWAALIEDKHSVAGPVNHGCCHPFFSSSADVVLSFSVQRAVRQLSSFDPPGSTRACRKVKLIYVAGKALCISLAESLCLREPKMQTSLAAITKTFKVFFCGSTDEITAVSGATRNHHLVSKKTTTIC